MNRNILIISETETFTVKGLEMKLKAINVDSVYCAPRLRDLEKLREYRAHEIMGDKFRRPETYGILAK